MSSFSRDASGLHGIPSSPARPPSRSSDSDAQASSAHRHQVDLAGIFFALDEAESYLVAGGAALLASDLIARPTEDLDLFAASPTTSVTPAKDAYVQTLRERSYEVVVIQDVPTFCRMVVARAGEETLVDLAIDSPPRNRPTITVLGPTLAPLELAARKLLALFGRAEIRDFADVYVLAQRFGKGALLEQVQACDAGFDLRVLAQIIRTIERFDDFEIPLAAAGRARTRLSRRRGRAASTRAREEPVPQSPLASAAGRT